jgi:O-methyltransferase domain
MTGTDSEQNDLEDRLRLKIGAYHDTALLHAAVTLGLPEAIDGRTLTAEALAAELGLSAGHLHRLLRGLASLDICAERPDGGFTLTSQGRSLMPGSPSRLREKVQVVVGQYWRPWAKLDETVKTGTPAFELVFGADVSDWRRDHAEAGAEFDSYLAHETLAQAPSIIPALDCSSVNLIAEIGGGYGGLLAAILQAYPGVAGILFDQPHRLEAAVPFLQSQGVAARVECISGDLLSAIPVEADLFLLNGVLQQWDDARARTVLSNLRKAMPGGAHLALVERLSPGHAADDPTAIMLDLHMMAITGGRVRSREDFARLLAEASLTLTKLVPTPSGLTVISARPA